MNVSYDGTAYSGFQTQPDATAIQDHIEAAIRSLTGESVKITASGRTDAGVHARAQVFNFHTGSQIPINRWCLAINSRLPDDILVTNAREVSETFHARHSSLRKTYRYTILNGRNRDVFRKHMEYHHYTPLDVQAMNEALTYFLGEHDFTAFCSTRANQISKVRTILTASLKVEDCEHDPAARRLIIEITGNGFLYNMVRIIVGTLIEVGEGKKSPKEIPIILESKHRKKAGPTAMSHGLMLWEVLYSE